MIRVLHVRDTFLRPTETFIYDIYTRMKGVESHFACERGANLDQFPARNVHSLDRESFLTRFYNAIARRMEGRFPFYDELAEYLAVDLIHAHFAPTGYYCLSAARAAGAPLVTSFYGQDVFEVPALRRWRERYKALFQEGALFLALSEDMKKDLIAFGCPEEKIAIHRLGIDLTQFSFAQMPERPALTILTIARLVEKKGIEYLIKAFAKVLKGRRVRLRIVGDGPLRPGLEALAGELGIREAVDFMGLMPFDKLPTLIGASDIFCLPSVTDRFGGKDEISMVLKEAMAMGLPVVATLHAGIPEVIKHGVQGFLAPERSVDGLVEALTALCDDIDLRRGMGRAGRALVEEVWDIQKQTERLRRLYEDLQKTRRPRG